MKQYLNIKTFHLFVVLCAMLFFSVSFAQEVLEESKEAEGTASNETKKNANTRKPKPKEKVFKPSEEISDDSPVPFPVDI